MDFSEKIAMLRRQKNWSQEELAEKLMVTRQAVSKWESAQSMPDLDKLVQLERAARREHGLSLKERYGHAGAR